MQDSRDIDWRRNPDIIERCIFPVGMLSTLAARQGGRPWRSQTR
jgi:hypothetical protein